MYKKNVGYIPLIIRYVKYYTRTSTLNNNDSKNYFFDPEGHDR
jgi:hypothetical protein